jgi:hypothetical protein
MADSIVDRVEEFIQRIHDRIYKIDPAANNMMFYNVDRTVNRSLSDHLSEKMHDYDVIRHTTPSPNLQDRAARNCLMWINKAFTYSVVKEGDGLLQKLEEKDKHM